MKEEVEKTENTHARQFPPLRTEQELAKDVRACLYAVTQGANSARLRFTQEPPDYRVAQW